MTKHAPGLVVVSIAVGGFGIGMILSTYVILREDINHSYADVNPPNIEVWTDPFETDLLQSLARIPGVDAVEGRRMVGIRARKGKENWQNLSLIGIPDFPGNINHLAPIEGSQFPGQDQRLVSQNLVHVTGFHTGDIIEIELPDGSLHQLAVAGLVMDQTTSKPDPNSTNPGRCSCRCRSSSACRSQQFPRINS